MRVSALRQSQVDSKAQVLTLPFSEYLIYIFIARLVLDYVGYVSTYSYVRFSYHFTYLQVHVLYETMLSRLSKSLGPS